MEESLQLNWCFSTLGCPELSFAAASELAVRYGFSVVEIRALENRLDLPEYLAEVYGSPTGFGKAIKAAPVGVRCLNSSFQLTSDSEKARAEFLEYARWADGAGIPALRAFDGGKECALVDDAVVQKILENLAWWQSAKAAEGFKSDLWIETHWSLCAPESVLKLAEAAPVPIKIIWDVFHSWRFGGRDPIETWELLRPHVAHIHFKDAVLDSDSPKGACHRGLGDGEVPLAALFERLCSDGYAGAASFEWERYWNPEIEPLEAMLERGKELGYWSL